jgi:hypothetical protein
MAMIENLCRAVSAYYRHEPWLQRMSFKFSVEVDYDDDTYLVLRDRGKRILAVYLKKFDETKLRRIKRWPKEIEDCYPDDDECFTGWDWWDANE